jgi:transcription elongation factor SPT5
MTKVFQYDKIQKVELKPKQWVRVKTGVYEGDLAQVIHVEDPISRVYIRLIPRIDESANIEGNKDNANKLAEYNRKIKKSLKPRQKLFNPKYYEGVQKKSHPVLNESVYFWNKQSFRSDGFLIKSVRAKSLQTEDVIPSLEELRIFDSNKFRKGDEDGGDANLDIDSLIQTIQESQISKKKVFNKGDKVKIVKGDLMNVPGKVFDHTKGVVQLIADVEGMNDEVLEFPEDYIVKYFMPGDKIKVVNGPHTGKYGLIVSVDDDTATVYYEVTGNKIKVSCHDIIISNLQVQETDHNSYYQFGDLVKINGNNTICYVLDVYKDSLKLINTRSEIQKVSLRDVMKLPMTQPRGLDRMRNPITKNDTVKITNGHYKGKRGVIKNMSKNFVFLYNQDFSQTNGIFVDKCENIEIMGSELLIDQNMNGGKVNFKKIPDELRKLVGRSVKIIKGNWKSYIGVLKEVNDKYAYVELSAKNKKVKVELSDIADMEEGGYNNNGNARSNLETSYLGTPRSYANNAKTPAYCPQSPGFNSISSPRWNVSTRI